MGGNTCVAERRHLQSTQHPHTIARAIASDLVAWRSNKIQTHRQFKGSAVIVPWCGPLMALSLRSGRISLRCARPAGARFLATDSAANVPQKWTVYLSGHIHSPWREDIVAQVARRGLPINITSAWEQLEDSPIASDDCAGAYVDGGISGRAGCVRAVLIRSCSAAQGGSEHASSSLFVRGCGDSLPVQQ